jgi:hypothetical protein
MVTFSVYLSIFHFILQFTLFSETNLKKQGMLPLRFANPSDYSKIKTDDRVSLVNLKSLATGKVNHLDLKRKLLIFIHYNFFLNTIASRGTN